MSKLLLQNFNHLGPIFNTKLNILTNKYHSLSKDFTRINRSSTKATIMTDSVEYGKAAAAKAAVDSNISTDCVVGIGSGSTMIHVLEMLVHRCKESNISVKCIPTSFQSKQLVRDFGLTLTDLDYDPIIDITIDGADEVDHNLVAIKGGGACLAQEKVVAAAAKRFIVVADSRKNSMHLGQTWKKGIPIEVLPMAYNPVRHRICELFNCNLDDIELRIGKEKAGPVVTDNGNFVLDWKFEPEHKVEWTSKDWKALSDQTKTIPGVVETGIFSEMIHRAYFGYPDGRVETRGTD